MSLNSSISDPVTPQRDDKEIRILTEAVADLKSFISKQKQENDSVYPPVLGYLHANYLKAMISELKAMIRDVAGEDSMSEDTGNMTIEDVAIPTSFLDDNIEVSFASSAYDARFFFPDDQKLSSRTSSLDSLDYFTAEDDFDTDVDEDNVFAVIKQENGEDTDEPQTSTSQDDVLEHSFVDIKLPNGEIKHVILDDSREDQHLQADFLDRSFIEVKQPNGEIKHELLGENLIEQERGEDAAVGLAQEVVADEDVDNLVEKGEEKVVPLMERIQEVMASESIDDFIERERAIFEEIVDRSVEEDKENVPPENSDALDHSVDDVKHVKQPNGEMRNKLFADNLIEPDQEDAAEEKSNILEHSYVDIRQPNGEIRHVIIGSDNEEDQRLTGAILDKSFIDVKQPNGEIKHEILSDLSGEEDEFDADNKDDNLEHSFLEMRQPNGEMKHVTIDELSEKDLESTGELLDRSFIDVKQPNGEIKHELLGVIDEDKSEVFGDLERDLIEDDGVVKNVQCSPILEEVRHREMMYNLRVAEKNDLTNHTDDSTSSLVSSVSRQRYESQTSTQTAILSVSVGEGEDVEYIESPPASPCCVENSIDAITAALCAMKINRSAESINQSVDNIDELLNVDGLLSLSAGDKPRDEKSINNLYEWSARTPLSSVNNF